jgi:isopentenyl-diphosphate delta-isomerase
MSSLNRKNDHILGVLNKKPGRADFSDIHLLHNCLPGCNLADINLETEYMGRTFRSPFFINAITGGTGLASRVNVALARVAKVLQLPMAVGSQKIALDNKSLRVERSFRIIRKINPAGNIWANLGSYADPDSADRAVKMIAANALQIHLNVPQELSMPEGELCFSGMLERISNIAACSRVPVIAKEVGFGIAAEEAELLADAGVAAIDISGKGGTNFIKLENIRHAKTNSISFEQWGLPTAVSLLETYSAVGDRVDILASGGLYHPLDAARALSLGAKAVGVAAMPLYILLRKNEAAVIEMFRNVELELKKIMMMTGSRNLNELRLRPVIITGLTAEWLERRGIDPNRFSKIKSGRY